MGIRVDAGNICLLCQDDQLPLISMNLKQSYVEEAALSYLRRPENSLISEHRKGGHWKLDIALLDLSQTILFWHSGHFPMHGFVQAVISLLRFAAESYELDCLYLLF